MVSKKGKMSKGVKIAVFTLMLSIGIILYMIMKDKRIFLDIMPSGYQVKIRNDSSGGGNFGDSRGSRKHMGIDIEAPHNLLIFAPFDAHVTKIGTVYSSTPDFKYIEIQGKGLKSFMKLRFMYVDQSHDLPLAKGGNVVKGQQIGRVQNIASYHGGSMINHVHVELHILGMKINPLTLFKI